MVRVLASNILRNSENKENILFLNEKFGLNPEWSYDGELFYSGASTYTFPETDISFMDLISNESHYVKAGLGRGLTNIARIIEVGGVKYVYNRSHNPIGINDNKNQIFILSQLKGNPHFVQLLAAYVKDNNAYMIYPYISGKTLGEFLRTSYTEDELRVVMAQSKKALDELHSFGIIHGDAHPDNIFIPDDLTTHSVFLIDFGGAVYTNSAEEFVSNFYKIMPILKSITKKGGRKKNNRKTKKKQHRKIRH